MKYPKRQDVESWLRIFGFDDIADNMLGAYVVGSVARKKARPDSDLDIAVIVPADTLTEDTLDLNTDILNSMADEVRWEDRRVDIQVFSDQDPRLKSYSKIPLKAYSQARVHAETEEPVAVAVQDDGKLPEEIVRNISLGYERHALRADTFQDFQELLDRILIEQKLVKDYRASVAGLLNEIRIGSGYVAL